MKAALLLGAAAWLGVLLALAGQARAAEDEGKALLQKSDCFACHQVDSKLVGPAYKDVAKKYAGDKEALPKLVKKVKEGGAGNWGQVPMAPHPQLSDEDLTKMVQWVLAQKPAKAKKKKA
jgi:cytochrome c